MERFCVNHPDRRSVFSTTSGGAHQRIDFCNECIPRHWRRR